MSSLSVRVNRRSRLRRPKPYRYCSNSVALATGGTRGVVFFAAMVFACIGSTPHGTSAFLALPRSSVGTRNGGDGACSCWGDRRNVAARTQPRRCDCSTSTAGSSVVRLSSKAEHIRERLVPAHDIASGSSVEETRMPELNHDEIRRYSRHLILPDVGVTGQRRLKASSVLAVGTGGLGSPALLYLAAAGVGRLGIVDNDVVDESNLQRQVIHGTATLGKPKVESARDRMLDVNPHVTVETFHEQLTSENALRILDGYDVVLDGSDNFPTKYLVNDACEILGIPNVYGAILGFEGQMSVFSYKGGPTYRDLLPSPPPPGLVPSCAEGGVLGILPGVVGCIQATEVIKILLGKGDVLSGRLLVYDALQMSFKDSNLDKTPGRPAVTSLIDYQGFCGFSASASNTPPVASGTPGGANGEEEGEKAREGFQRISPQDVVAKMQAGWAPYVLDVRLPQEAEIASLPFVDRVCPHRKVSGIVRQLPRGTDLLVHCKVGGRSAKACATLSEHGIPEARLYNMEGGIIRWAKEVDSSLAVY